MNSFFSFPLELITTFLAETFFTFWSLAKGISPSESVWWFKLGKFILMIFFWIAFWLTVRDFGRLVYRGNHWIRQRIFE